jgi:uncharacterized damage-inducible protein DinB
MKSYYINIFKYNDWANAILIKGIKEQKVAEESVLRLLSHYLISEKVWMMRIKDEEHQGKSFWDTLSIDECEKFARENAAVYSSFLNSSTEESLNEIIKYKNSKGTEYKNSVADSLTHVAFHSSYHRAQIAKEMRRINKEPIYTDYIQYVRVNGKT